MAFLTDPSIPLQVKTPNLAQVYLQAQQIKGAQQENANRQTLGQIYGQEQQLNQLKVSQAQQDYGDQQAVNDSLSQHAQQGTDGKASVDYNGVVGDLYKTGHGRAAQGMQAQMDAAALAKQKSDLEAQGKQYELAGKHLEYVDRILQGVHDQPSLDQAIRTGLELKLFTPDQVGPGKEVNTIYTPEEIAQAHAQTLSYKDVIAQKQKETDEHLEQVKAEEDARHHHALETIEKTNSNLRAGELDNARNPKSMVYVPQADGTVQTVLAKPGMTLPKGSGTLSGVGTAGKATDKQTQAYQGIVDEADLAHQAADLAGKGNAEGDADLALSFFKTMKGANGSGIRFTQAEQNLIKGARGSSGDLQAAAQKVIGNGQMFTPKQRQDILQIIDLHANAARGHLGGTGGGSSSPAGPGTHVFSLSAWQKANPGGDARAAQAEAERRGFQVVQ
jgi:hypothetical protein